mgnify:CR=1 FL=1
MKHMTFRERRYRRAHLDCVRHITLDPKGPGVVRIHMIPPKDDTPDAPFLLLLNGARLVPLNLSWAIMLANLMDQLQAYEGQDLAEDQWESLLTAAVEETHRTYPRTKRQTLASDLHLMLTSLVAIAQGREPEAEVGLLSLSDYAPEMTAPHRMDLMVSAMEKDGGWHCNQKCLHCYAAGQPMGETPELSTEQWKTALALLRKANIPQVTFTGGEPTLWGEQLVSFIRKVKEQTDMLVKLDTNGTHPDVLRECIAAGIDYVAMDIKSSEERYHIVAGHADTRLDKVKESVSILLGGEVDYEFRTTAVKPLHTAEDFNGIGQLISGAKRYFIQCYKDSGDILIESDEAAAEYERSAVGTAELGAYSKDELESFLAIAKKYIPTAELRGVD